MSNKKKEKKSNLHDSEQKKYHALFENTIAALFITKPDGSILEANSEACKMFGYTNEEFRKSGRQGIIDPETPGLKDRLKEREKEGNTKGELIGIRKNGDHFWCEFSSSVFEGPDGDTLASVMMVDISERKLAEEHLKSVENNVPGVVFRYKLMADGTDSLEYVSEGSTEIWGVSPEEAMSDVNKIWSWFHEDDVEAVQKSIEKSARELNQWYTEYRFHHPDGSLRWYRSIGNPIYHENDVVIWDSIIMDITAEVEAQKQLEESNRRYEYATQATSDAIWEYKPETNELFWGEGFKILFGYDRKSEGKGINWWMDKIHPDEKEHIESLVLEMLKGSDTKWDKEYRFKKADGSYAYVRDKAIVIRDEKNRAERVVGAMEDITQKKQEEQYLKLMESVVTNTSDAVIITKAEPMDAPDGPEIIYVNDAFGKMTGYSSDEVLGKTPRILAGPNSDHEALKKFDEKLHRWESASLETINYKKNGEEFWVNFSMSPITNEKGEYTHWIAVERDITERKNRELKQRLIAEVSRIFNEEKSVREALKEALKRLKEFGKFEITEVWLTSHDGKSIDLAASLKKEAEQFYSADEEIVSFAFGKGLPGKTWKTGKTQFWKNLDKRKTFLRNKAAKKAGLKTAYGLPIIFDKETKGVLLLGLKDAPEKPNYYSPILEDIARQLGEEIQRKELEEELSRIFSSAPDVICVADFDGYYRKVNPAMSELLGYSEEELLTNPIMDFVHPEDKGKTREEFNALNRGEGSHYFENRHLTKSGKIIWLSWTTKPYYEEGITYSVAKDVSDQKELEELLNQANRLAKIGSWRLDLIDNSIYWSDMTRKIHEEETGFEPDLDTGISYYKEGEPRETISAAVEKTVKSGTPWDLELPIITAKGNEKWIRTIGEAEMADGKCVRIRGSFQDIHQRKEAELAYKKAFEERINILESIGDSFFAVDSEWVVTYWNHKAEEVLGMQREQIVGKNLWDIYDDAITLDFYKQYHKAVNEQTTVHFDEYYPALDKWFEVSAYPSSSGLSVFFKDITEQKEYQAKLLEKTRQIDAIARFNGLLINKENWLDALDESLELFGEVADTDRVYFFERDVPETTGEDTISMKVEWVREGIDPEIGNPDHHHLPVHEIQDFINVLTNGKAFNKKVKNIKDREFSEFLREQSIQSILAIPVFVHAEFRGFIGFDDCTTEREWTDEEFSFLHTITINLASAIENEDAEIALQKAFEEKNEILESIGDGFFAVDEDFTVTYWNNMAEELLHTPKEKIVGEHLWDVFGDATELESYNAYNKALDEQAVVHFEDYYAPINSWFEISAYPSSKSLSVFFRDVTERKKADEQLKELNRSLEEQTKELAVSNAELEQFAFVASHDLQEPLRMITGFMAQLERKYDSVLDERGRKYIHFATDGAKRMRQIILDLLDFSRIGRIDTERESVDLSLIMEDVLSLNKKIILEKKAKIEVGKLPVICAAKASMRQLFQNLVNNAVKYHDEDSVPKITITSDEREKEWKFSVSDNGIGINKEYLDKIFNIFQRLHVKEEYEGTGMGLAICKKIVEDHRGEIWVESEKDKGSTFYFTISKNQPAGGNDE